jgi:hypothetical protein
MVTARMASQAALTPAPFSPPSLFHFGCHVLPALRHPFSVPRTAGSRRQPHRTESCCEPTPPGRAAAAEENAAELPCTAPGTPPPPPCRRRQVCLPPVSLARPSMSPLSAARIAAWHREEDGLVPTVRVHGPSGHAGHATAWPTSGPFSLYFFFSHLHLGKPPGPAHVSNSRGPEFPAPFISLKVLLNVLKPREPSN